MTRHVNFGLWYDFRNPAPWTVPFEQMYADSLDQIAEAEVLGFDSVWLTEHHFCADGYTPSPLVIAASTSRGEPDAATTTAGTARPASFTSTRRIVPAGVGAGRGGGCGRRRLRRGRDFARFHRLGLFGRRIGSRGFAIQRRVRVPVLVFLFYGRVLFRVTSEAFVQKRNRHLGDVNRHA